MKLWSVLLSAAVIAGCGEQRTALSVPHIVSFSATQETLVAARNDATLSWEVEGSPAQLVITPDVGLVRGSSVRVAPVVTTVYTLTADNTLGSHSARTTVSVPTKPNPTPPEPAPSDLMGPWVFEIVGDRGTEVSGEFYLDDEFVYNGASGLRGAVYECRGEKYICNHALTGSVVYDSDAEVYGFSLGVVGGTLVFSGKDEDGKLTQNAPLHYLLEGRGTLGRSERVTFVTYQLGK